MDVFLYDVNVNHGRHRNIRVNWYRSRSECFHFVSNYSKYCRKEESMRDFGFIKQKWSIDEPGT